MAITMDGIFVNGQKALFRPEDIIDGDVSAYAEAVGSAVEEWMEENVTGGEQVTDTTLTLPGVPADAEITGNKIEELKEELNDTGVNLSDVLRMSDITNVAYSVKGEGYIQHADGDIHESSNNLSVTDYIDVSAFDYLYFKRMKSTIYEPATGMAFYNKDKTYISGIPSVAHQESNGYEDNFYTVFLPYGAVYARFSIYTDTETYGVFELRGKSRLNEIADRVESAEITPTISGTYNGVTMSVESDGSLKLYGTPSEARRFCCLNGQASVKSTTSAFEKTLDAGIYEIETTVTGTVSALLWKVSSATFANDATFLSKSSPKTIVSFDAPVMIGFMMGSSSNYGTSESPTYIKFTAKKLTAKDIVARARAEKALSKRIVAVKPLAGGMHTSYGGDTLTYSSYYDYRKISDLIQLNGASEVTIKLNPTMAASVASMRVYYYAESNSAITYLSSQPNFTFTGGECTFTPANGAAYFRAIFILASSTTADLGEIEIIADAAIEKLPLPNIVNTTFDNITFAYNVSGDVYTSGQLMLPPNYDVKGKKVPLYVVLHGTSSMNTWDEAIGANSGDSTKYLLEYMTNEGFAVFDCYPFTSKYYKTTGQIAAAPLPMIKRAFEEGIKYVCEHYNVDINRVCFSAMSLGGQLGYYFAGSSCIKPKAIAMLAPSTGYASVIFNTFFLTQSGRQLIVDVLGLENDANATLFIETDKGMKNDTVKQFVLDHQDQFAGFIGYADNVHGATYAQQYEWMTTAEPNLPEWMTELNLPAIASGWTAGVPAIVNHPELSKYEPTPMKYWAAFDDVNTSTHANYTIYQWLKNGGTDVQWRTLANNTGGHHAIDTSPTAEVVSGTTRLGIAYSDISIAYKEMADFFHYQLNT